MTTAASFHRRKDYRCLKDHHAGQRQLCPVFCFRRWSRRRGPILPRSAEEKGQAVVTRVEPQPAPTYSFDRKESLVFIKSDAPIASPTSGDQTDATNERRVGYDSENF